MEALNAEKDCVERARKQTPFLILAGHCVRLSRGRDTVREKAHGL